VRSADRFRVDAEALRQQHPIDRVVQSYGVDLRRAGNALVGRCPFHKDTRRPNLYVYCHSGRWICYRCDKRGDAISFVQEIEDVSFKDAVARLSGQPDGRPARQRRYQPLVMGRRPRGL
jgi:DNA primase